MSAAPETAFEAQVQRPDADKAESGLAALAAMVVIALTIAGPFVLHHSAAHAASGHYLAFREVPGGSNGG